jgi:hypothetical protein
MPRKLYEKLLLALDSPEPPAALASKIIARIEHRQELLLRARIAVSGACIMGSASIVAYGFINAATELSRSGFFSFVSLAFSDFSSAFANFPDFILSIAESVPALPIALLFGGMLFFLWSAQRLSKVLSTKTVKAFIQ